VKTDISAKVSSFLDYKFVERGIAESTRQSYREGLANFISFLGHKTTATEADIKRYISSCFEHKVNPRTVAHRLSALRGFFKFLQRDGFIKRDPMVNIQSPRMWKKLPRFLSESEAQQFIDAPGPNRPCQALGLRDRAICELLYASAIRVSELTSAKLLDLNLASRFLTVLGKGNKERRAVFGLRAVDALSAYLNLSRPILQAGKVSPYLFVGSNRPCLTRQAVNYLLRRRAKRAGIAHVHPHLLRHSCATHMLNQDANLRVIQEILGHADIGTTEIYTHVSSKRVKEIVLRCHPRNNPKRAQLSLFETASTLAPGFNMCVQCRNPVCADSKCYCSMHLQLAAAASLRSYHKKKTLASRSAQHRHDVA